MTATFAAFRHRNYRLWFFGQLISLAGTWMQNAAQGYLVYSLTGSAAFLGSVALVSGAPSWILLLVGGMVADRVSRRALMLISQIAMMLLAFVLAALVFLRLVQPWHILVLAFLLGVARAFEVPARQSLVAELVEHEELTNAIALNTAMFNTGMIVGPAVAGAVYALAGPAWCFTINGLSFLAIIAALVMMKLPGREKPARRPPALDAVREGLRYASSHPAVRSLIGSAFFYNIYDYAIIILIPAWAVKLLHGDAATNGLLMAVNAAGAVLGGLGLATFAGRVPRGKIWAISSFVTPPVIVVFALSHALPLSLAAMVVLGITSITVMNNTNAMLQSSVPDDLRGRVMSLFMLGILVGGPLGSVAMGWVAQTAGEMSAALACAGMAALFAGWIVIRKPAIRDMK